MSFTSSSSGSQNGTTLSVLIPLYNEEEFILELLRRVVSAPSGSTPLRPGRCRLRFPLRGGGRTKSPVFLARARQPDTDSYRQHRRRFESDRYGDLLQSGPHLPAEIDSAA